MQPEIWRRVEELYHAALARPAAERGAFLRDACGSDEGLRREVQRLLTGHEQAGTFLDSQAWKVADAEDPSDSGSLIGQAIGHYRVASSLGRGGMGEVYLAEDTRLNRQIALKLLPARFTQDADRLRRFEQEIRAASALNHPNIITVYDIGQTDAGRFIAMEYVAGRTLRALADDGLGPQSVVRLGRQIAEALAVAHAAGIVHRDIKPDNVMVRGDGYVKVLDFGLARLVTGEAADHADPAVKTRPGIILGTMPYMSPEQARGEPIGTATDIFSLGIVLYELAAGRHPFRADSAISVLHGILSSRPAPLSEINPAIPESVATLTLRMLEKDPGRRPTATEVVASLAEEAARTSGGGPTPVARDVSAPGRTRTGSRAIALAAMVGVVAVAAAAAWWLQGSRDPAPSTPVSPSDTSPVLSASSLATRPRLSTGAPASAIEEANRYFESAMQAAKALADFPRARTILERALEVDPKFAEARAWYGFTSWLLLDSGYSNDSTLLYNAEEEMRRALQDDPGLARAHAGFAAVYLMQGRRELMPSELDQALAANPDDEDALHLLMHYHHYNGDYAAAQQAGRRVLARLPLFFPTRMILGDMLRQQGDLTGAIREHERILEHDPQNAYALRFLARAYFDAADLVRARQTLSRMRPADRGHFRTRRAWALLLALEGQRTAALKEMDEEVLKWLGLVAYETAEAADFYAILGDTARALDWLDRAVRSGDERAEWFRNDPLLANVRDHPRFGQILSSIAYRRQQRQPPS